MSLARFTSPSVQERLGICTPFGPSKKATPRVA
jgi:hypothetical protein